VRYLKSAKTLLGDQLEAVERDAASFVKGVKVHRAGSLRQSGVVMIRPDYEWSEITDDQRRSQRALRRAVLDVLERVRLLFVGASPEVKEIVDDVKKRVFEWVDLGLVWSLSGDPDRNDSSIRSEFAPLKDLLKSLTEGENEVFIVPDTNALTTCPDPVKYQALAKTSRYHFLLLAPVLGELDKLKYKARDDAYRKKVGATIRRIAGWRRQGRLVDGVTVYSSITVRALAPEPHFAEALSWLDSENGDDRVIAATMEVQRQFAAGVVILVTDDLNLQNKADAAGVAWADVPGECSIG
jgi:rRNA-processing protein FCF1